MFRKLHTKMMLFFGLLMLVSLSAVSFINYLQVDHEVNRDIRNQAEGIAAQLKNTVEMYLDKHRVAIEQFSRDHTLLEYISEQDEAEKDEKWQDLKWDFSQYVEINPNVQALYVADSMKRMNVTPDVELPEDFDPTTRPWYWGATQVPDSISWTEPYIDVASNEYVITVSKVVKERGTDRIMGVIGMDISLDQLDSIVSGIAVGYHGFPVVFDRSGTAVVHPTHRGENLYDHSFIQEMYTDSKEKGTIEYTFENEERVMLYETIDLTKWKIGTVYFHHDLHATANTLRNINILTTIVIVLISLVIIYFVSKNITRPIIRLNEEVTKMAKGDLTVEIKAKSNDEIGKLTHNFTEMVRNIRDLLDKVNKSTKIVNEASENLSAISEETTASNEEVARAVSDIAEGATTVASSCDEMNGQAHTLSTQIEVVKKQTAQMDVLSDQTASENEKGLLEVKQLQQATIESANSILSIECVIKSLFEKMHEIENIMDVITDISAQTNLLALNASIEAARAGEHGKGFAVVADEVRKLADQSSKATEQVRHTLNKIQVDSESAVKEMNATKEITAKQTVAVENTEKAFAAISDTTKKMLNSIEAITNEVDEVNKFKNGVVTSIESISSMIQQSAATSEQVSASAQEQLSALHTVAQSAEQLRVSSEELAVLIEKFKLE